MVICVTLGDARRGVGLEMGVGGWKVVFGDVIGGEGARDTVAFASPPSRGELLGHHDNVAYTGGPVT